MKSLARQTVLLAVLALSFWTTARSQPALSLQGVEVLDAVATQECHPNFGTFHLKGNGDGTLSPGDRVALRITLKNELAVGVGRPTHTYRDCYGTLSTTNSHILPTSADCFLGGDGLIGAPFTCPIPPGAVATNSNGVFVLDISQALGCDQMVEFSLFLTYWTQDDACGAGGCTQSLHFSLPIFELTKSHDIGSEELLLPAWESRKVNGTASSGKDIGVYCSAGFGILDLDANQTASLVSIPAPMSPSAWHSALIWNALGAAPGSNPNPRYDTLWLQGDDWSDTGTVSVAGASVGATAEVIDNNSANGPLAASYDMANNLIGALYPAMAQYGGPPVTQRCAVLNIVRNTITGYQSLLRVPLGPARRGSYEETWPWGGSYTVYVAPRFATAFLEGSGTTPPVFIAAWEDHDIATNTHFIRLSRVRTDTFQVMGTPVAIPVVCGHGAALPALTVDPGTRRIALVWQDAPSDPLDRETELFLQVLTEDLVPLQPFPFPLTDTWVGWAANSASLVYKNGLCVAWLETNVQAGGASSRVKVATADISGGLWAVVQTQALSSEWLNMGGLHLVDAVDRLYAVWHDQRDSIDIPFAMRSAMILPISETVPLNVDTEDDPIVSQSYDVSSFPSLASRGDEFLLAWRYAEESGNIGDIYASRYGASGTPLGPMQCISGSTEVLNEWTRPFALATSSGYDILWWDWQTATSTGALWRWRSSDWGPASSLLAVQHQDSRLLGTAVNPYGYGALAFMDMRAGDNDLNLYLYAEGGVVPLLRLTDFPSGGTEALYGAEVVFTGDSAAPWMVAWCESNYILDTDPLPPDTSHWGRVLKLARFDFNLTQVGPTLVLDEGRSTNMGHGALSLTTTGNRILLLYEVDVDATGCERVLRLWELGADGAACGTRDLSSGVMGQYSGSTPFFFWPHVRWSGTHAIASWGTSGPPGMTASTQNLFMQWFTDFGDPVAWPMRVTSPMVRMLVLNQTDFVVCATDEGGAAAYGRDSESFVRNVYMTTLGWPAGTRSCVMYNQPPTVEAYGPYTVEFGANLSITGGAGDDDRGDSVVQRGWDLSNDGVIDLNGFTVNLTPTVMAENGIWWPGLYSIRFMARDTHGAWGYDDAILNVVDTAAPTVAVNTPNGGETLRVGQTVVVAWDGSDNHELQKWDASYCTNYGAAGGETWLPLRDAGNQPSTNLPPWVRSFDWVVPDELSATCRIKVVGTDYSSNAGQDISDKNFYIVQLTTTAVRTLVLWHSARTDAAFGGGSSGALFSKLTELANHTKVSGVVLDLNNVVGLDALYSAWDAAPVDTPENRAANVAAANAVASAIRDYVVGQVGSTYTNAQYLVLAGDDRLIPFYRVPDGTAISPESSYPTVNAETPVGAALERKYYLTDGVFGDMDYDATAVGATFLALPDLATGRLVETPAEMAATVNGFIALDGQISLNKVYITGHDFLQDSAAGMRDTYASAGKTVLTRIGDSGWSGTTMDADLFAAPFHALVSVNNHCDHANIATPDGGDPLTALEIDGHSGTPLRGTMLYSVGCHSGLSAPDDQFAGNSPMDLPQAFLRKGLEAYIGNTGYGWGLKYGSGYSEKLAEMLTARVLSQPSVALGRALAEAKRDYFVQDHRYDVFDEKVLFESTLYGLPMYQVVVSGALLDPKEELPGAEGPDEQEAGGVTLQKKLRRDTGALPSGVTELTLNFAFGGGTYQKVTTADGDYYTLNGRSSAEIGDTLQPLFTYDSRLSGTVSHGVLFTGGDFTTESPFEPVVGTPDSSSYVPGGESPIGPAAGGFIPTVNATNPQVPTSLLLTDLTRMTVYTGYYDAAGTVETKFDQMGFVIYYSNSADKTKPAITDPGVGGVLHSMGGLTANFSVQASDASGIYRVVVVYTDKVSEWESFDLAYNTSTSRWEGALLCKKNILYHVQAVDNAGNVGYLRQSGADQVPGGGDTGSTYQYARIFAVTLADTDTDGMPDAYETAHGLNPAVNDAGGDPDYDGLTNLSEFNADTDPQKGDTDGDGDNDGSEKNNSRNPLVAGDGKRITVALTLVNGGLDVQIDWPSGTGDNGIIDGPYWIYRSLDPFFSSDEEMDTAPKPLTDGAVTYTDVGGGSGATYYYTVTNVRYTGPAPTVLAAAPNHGPQGGGTTVLVFGSGFASGAGVTVGGVSCTGVSFINANTLQCVTPAGTAGAKEVKVTNPNGQFGALAGGFTYDP